MESVLIMVIKGLDKAGDSFDRKLDAFECGKEIWI